jgi:hypothetical protein
MRIRTTVRAGVVGLVIGVAACAREVGGVQRFDTASVAARIAAEATTELALSPGEQMVSPRGVRLEDGPHVGGGLTTYRAWIPRDHWHAYQIAIAGSNAIALGGFQSPELASAAAALAPSNRNATTVRELAEKLAVLADNSGAVEYIFPGRTDLPDLRAAWERTAPESWPRDTVIDLGGGKWRAVLTMLSRETRSYTQHWVPVAYAFSFDSNGRLQSWSRRIGESLAAARFPAAAPRPYSDGTTP